MTRDSRDYVQDILDAIDETAAFTRGMTFEQFDEDRKTYNAVIRSLEVLGEAAKNIPAATRASATTIPWNRMAGMRDKLIHQYFGVDKRIVWAVITEELPPLREAVQTLLDELRP
jgi:uncharacterized protein with HEPN domain